MRLCTEEATRDRFLDRAGCDLMHRVSGLKVCIKIDRHFTGDAIYTLNILLVQQI